MSDIKRRAFSAAVYLMHENLVLMVEHPRYGCLLPIGGELEPGESPLEAAIRETREEAGVVLCSKDFWRPSSTPPCELLLFEEHVAEPKAAMHWNFNFVAGAKNREFRISSEHSSMCWHDPAALLKRRDLRENVKFCLNRIVLILRLARSAVSVGP